MIVSIRILRECAQLAEMKGEIFIMLSIFKKTKSYYQKIYGILFLCVILGLTQSILLLAEPQIISLMVDSVINPALSRWPTVCRNDLLRDRRNGRCSRRSYASWWSEELCCLSSPWYTGSTRASNPLSSWQSTRG